MINKKLLENEETRSEYFHDLAEDSRSLELLLNASYSFGMTVSNIKMKKTESSFIIFEFKKNLLHVVSALMELVSEFDSTEYSIKCDRDGYKVKLTYLKDNSEELFIRIKEIMEESVYEKKQTFNYKVISSVYNIAKIVKEAIDADILFAIDKKLFGQGKCYLAIYKDKQILKLNFKKADNLDTILEKLKQSVLRMPTVLLCSFEELRTFYFELDEIVYSKDLDGEIDG